MPKKFIRYTGTQPVSIDRVGEFVEGDVREVDAPVALGLIGSPGWEIFDTDPRVKGAKKAPAATTPEKEVKDGA